MTGETAGEAPEGALGQEACVAAVDDVVNLTDLSGWSCPIKVTDLVSGSLTWCQCHRLEVKVIELVSRSAVDMEHEALQVK